MLYFWLPCLTGASTGLAEMPPYFVVSDYAISRHSHSRQAAKQKIGICRFASGGIINWLYCLAIRSEVCFRYYFSGNRPCFFVPAIFRIVKHIKEGARTYPVIDLDEASGKIVVSYKDIVVTVDITQIKNLRLQYKSERLVSTIVTTSSGEVMRLEGYENLEILAATLERFTPKERVTNAKFYHR
ncbi:MAG: hypothetical protein B7Y41_13920 [Hydrogenophilales bacterium 28-61-23]|nr:MAG: hypothetical protein B7Y41_13920 [Hydrogenophilales bacterium 28-61-23]